MIFNAKIKTFSLWGANLKFVYFGPWKKVGIVRLMFLIGFYIKWSDAVRTHQEQHGTLKKKKKHSAFYKQKELFFFFTMDVAQMPF